MLLYENICLNMMNQEKIRVVSYNIDHGNDFNNEANAALRKTLQELIYTMRDGENENCEKFIFLQECTQDIVIFLSELLANDTKFSMLHSKKIINDKTRKYNNFEYFITIYKHFSSKLELRHSDLIEINPIKLLSEAEKQIMMNTSIGKNKSISLYRKLLDSNKLMVGHEQFKMNNNKFINFFNIHLSSKPYLNFIQAYLFKKYLAANHANSNENNIIIGDFNNKFNSSSLNLIKQDLCDKELNYLDLKLKNKSSKIRNLNKVSHPEHRYENVTDKLLEEKEKNIEYINKSIDHILYEKKHFELATYHNNMDVLYDDCNAPSDHFYVDCLFRWSCDKN
ncbi:hypothetical protein QEN19_001378 [Hanseniaspora menglaensis]